MDSSDYSAGKPPKKELQGPRPTPLKVRKDSHKFKKPPPAPPQQQPQYRPPVIIYTVSPKVIHTNPNEFMTLVQRLTGSSSSSCTSNPNFHNNNIYDQSLSPAARYAITENAKSPKGKEKIQDFNIGMNDNDGDDDVTMIERRSCLFPGILSPGPASLAPIQPDFFFSPVPSDPNSLSRFLHDLSPMQHGNKTFIEGSFMNSPSPNMDFFNNFFGY